jgi:hypothetical protein
VRQHIAHLEKEIHAALGPATVKTRVLSIGALLAAAWTAVKLKWDLFQHPRLVRHTYRIPSESFPLASAWQQLKTMNLPLSVELRQSDTIWLRLEHMLNEKEWHRLTGQLKEALNEKSHHLVVDLEKAIHLSQESAHHLALSLEEFRERVKFIWPDHFLSSETVNSTGS